MTGWTIIRFLHLVGMAFFVGGQLMLAVTIAPAVRRHGGDEAMRPIARRFGIGSAVALAVIIATGIAMASHYGDWDRGVLHAKLALLVLVFVLTGLHTVVPQRRALSYATLLVSIAIVYLGVDLAH
jgi:putative copper export protein